MANAIQVIILSFVYENLKIRKIIIFLHHCQEITPPHPTFFFLATLHSMQDLSSLIRDQTFAPCDGSMES